MDPNPYLCKGMDRKLYKALMARDAKLLDQVVEEGTVHVLQELTPADDNALHIAAFYGHHLQANVLTRLASADLEAGNQFLRAQNKEGNTALHVASKRGCKKIVKMLVETDSDVARVKNNRGETALFKASESGHVGIVEYLLEFTPDELDRRADGRTPLHAAVANLHTGVTAMLLEKRPALSDKADDLQRTALHTVALVAPRITAWNEKILLNVSKIGQMLLNEDISLVYRVDFRGQSALHLAAKVGNYELVQIILGTQFIFRTVTDCTQIILGTVTDCTHISDGDGRSPLHLAVENAAQIYNWVGSYALRIIIPSLVLRGLIDCSDKSGQTVLDIAMQNTEKDPELFLAIRDFLRKHGASRNMYETETREDSASSTLRNSTRRTDILSIIVALIATVAFAAAFTLPGDIDSHENPPVPFLLNVSLFKLFVLFDSLAFVISIGSAVLFYASGSQEEDNLLTNVCFLGVWAAVTCIALAFGAAIHLVVARKCLWLAGFVWVMVCSLPMGIRLYSLLGKANTFVEPKGLLMRALAPPRSVMHVICLVAIGVPFLVGTVILCASLFGMPYWTTKALRRLSKIVRRRMRR